MGTEDNGGDMGFQSRDAGSMFKSSNGAESYFGFGWDPLISLNQNENFGPQNGFSNPAYQVVIENQALSSSSHLVHYQSDSGGLGEMVPKLSCFGSGSFSEMVNSFGLPECEQIGYTQNKEGGSGKALLIGTESLEGCLNSEDKVSPNEKKRRKMPGSHPPSNLNQSDEIEQQQDPSGDNSLEMEDNKQRIEHNIHDNSRGKQTCKQAKENSNSGIAGKDSYIHVRAKRGQATNSHSLAERVRREKISERMRLLQKLVPGCNKITGKAVMLDEIINYVQSLQQQVEFLSMKLATVNPEINIDIDRFLSKDILNSRVSNSAVLGFPGGLLPPHPFPHGSLTGIPNTTQPFHSMPQVPWDNELHNLWHMGFDASSNLEPTGRSKLDL